MIYIVISVIQASCQKIQSLQENIICEIKPCDQEIKQYNYGIETFGDLTNTKFTLQFLFNVNASSSTFVASINDGQNWLLNISLVSLSSQNLMFNITNTSSQWLTLNYQTSQWYQIVFTQTMLQICDFQNCLSTNHYQTISPTTRFNFLNSSSTDYHIIQACCIIMYRGIEYLQEYQITFYNTKYPEGVIDMNIQEKIQSNITLDYSDYKYIAKLGDLFDFDQYDPYLMNEGLMYNGSQYIQINQITLNDQLSFEFRIQTSNKLTSNIILLNYTHESQNYNRIYIFLNSSSITYKQNDYSISFQLEDYNYIHFCIGKIQYLSGGRSKIYFIQFSDSQILQVQSQNMSDYFYPDNGLGYLNIGSKQNQFNSADYFHLLHFRYYQGFFIDTRSVMQINCQIYLNDRCIICKLGYQLLNDNTCALQCDSSTYLTALVSSHNQCQRQCHPICATCNLNSPAICLTCSGNRASPPICNCPNNHFEDNVSPDCRKYYPEVGVQTGTLSVSCVSNLIIYYGFKYKIKPSVVLSLVGTTIIYNSSSFQVVYSMIVSLDSFQINFTCIQNNQFYVINWMSSVGSNNLLQSQQFYKIPNSFSITSEYQILFSNGVNLNPIYQCNGWQYKGGSQNYYLKWSLFNQTSIMLSAEHNIFKQIYYSYFYTQFKTYYLSNTALDTQIDNQPKSVKHIIIQRGFQIDSYDKFIYITDERNSTYFSIKSVYNKTMQIFDWLLILASQSCQNNNGACNFYESYNSFCNHQFTFCDLKPADSNFFINSSYYYQCINLEFLIECDVNCKTCYVNSSNCTSCYIEQNMILKNTTMNFSKCYCDDGYYLDAQQHLCLDCNIKCGTCNGPLENQCLTCDSNRQLTEIKTCSCLARQYDDEYNSKKCQNCPENCLQCSNSNECKKCENNLTIQNGLCKCQKGFYKYDKQCLTCESKLGKYFIECSYKNCFDKIYTPSEECDDGNLISYDGCTNCKIDNNYQCYNQVNKVSICYKCQNQCSNCKLYDGRIICQNCNDGYFLTNNNCIECSKNCKNCQSFSQCIECHLMNTVPNEQLSCPVCSHGSYLQINQCVTKCGDGIKSLDEQCDDGNLNSADGCDYQCKIEESYVCQIDEDRSNCFPSQAPKLFINNLLKVTNDQYKIQIMSDQLVKFKKLGVLLNLQNHMEYNFTYDVDVSQNQQFYSQMEINITINFSVSAKQLIFKIQIDGDIQNNQSQKQDQAIFLQFFENIIILQTQQAQTSQFLSELGGKLFYVTLIIFLLQLVFSEASDSAQLIMKTQNYLQYLLFINIEYPPNLVFILNQFADSNILKYIDMPQFLCQLLNFNIKLDQFVENEPLYYNKQQITTNFFVNIYLFASTLVQSVLLIKLSQVVVNRVQQQIICQILSKKTYDSKMIKLLSFIQYHLLKTICQFRNNGIRQIYFVAQYNIYFAIFIRLKTLQLNSYYTIFEIILTLLASIICGFYVFNQSKGQSAITIITNIHPICFIFCIVFLYNFQLQQLLIIALQSLILVSLLLSNGIYKQNIQGIVQESSILVTFLSSVFYIYNPFDVDQILIGFIQLVAILSTFIVNVFLQLTGLYFKFIKYNSLKSKKGIEGANIYNFR